jgi:hypothetical protein
MQIIAGALLAAPLVMLAVFVYLVEVKHQGGTLGRRDVPVFALVTGVMLLACVPMAVAVPAVMTRAALRRIRTGTWQAPPGADPASFATVEGQLLAVRQTTMIVGLAPLEGTATTACIGYFLEAQPLLLVFVAFVLGWMILRFPTRARVRAWLERQASELAQAGS